MKLEQYSNHCRTCLGVLNDAKISIHDKKIFLMLSQCTTILASITDGLMEYICETCYNKLLCAYEFKEKCEAVDKYLREIIADSKSDNCHTYSVTTDKAKHITCSLCNKDFTRKTTLRVHLQRHFKNNLQKCDLCQKTFSTKSDLKAHTARHNSELFKCHTCGRCFLTKNSLSRHVKIHLNIKQFLCPYCGKRFRLNDTLQTHLKGHTKQNLLTCEFCEKKFAARASLSLHLKKHLGEEPYLCSVCGLKLKTSSDLKKHEIKHSGLIVTPSTGELQICEVCGKSYRFKSSLTKHMVVHMPETYNCEECSHRFFTVKDLELHKIVHSRNFPFLCVECKRGFNRKSNYIRHIKTVHNK